jgi:hypothetical protein
MEKQPEDERKQRIQEREDIATPHQCTAEPLDYEGGVSLHILKNHAAEFNQLVIQMMEDMTHETRILEGTSLVDYTTLRDELDASSRGTATDTTLGAASSSSPADLVHGSG